MQNNGCWPYVSTLAGSFSKGREMVHKVMFFVVLGVGGGIPPLSDVWNPVHNANKFQYHLPHFSTRIYSTATEAMNLSPLKSEYPGDVMMGGRRVLMNPLTDDCPRK